MSKFDLNVDEIDKLTGPVIGRPKSATFRTSDVVGLDTLVKVSNNLYAGLVKDEGREMFKLPAVVNKLEENKWLGDKTGQGFYKKTKGAKGETEILTLDLKTLEYKPKTKVKFATLETTKTIDNLKDRFKVLLAGKDKAEIFIAMPFMICLNMSPTAFLKSAMSFSALTMRCAEVLVGNLVRLKPGML
jgi:3-hydroxyacyl-CoA dehydrogenase